MRVNVLMRGAKCKNGPFHRRNAPFHRKNGLSGAKKRVKCPIGTNRTTTYEQSDNKTGQSFASKRWQYLNL